MQYPILRKSSAIMSRIRNWVRIQRCQFNYNLIADFISCDEVRIVNSINGSAVSMDNVDGCTISLRQNTLMISCAESCTSLETKIISFLKKENIVGNKITVPEPEKFIRKNIKHAHELGRPVSDEAKIKRKEKSFENRNAPKVSRFKTVIEATDAAGDEAGVWLIITERAKQTAEQSCFEDPDYVYKALKDLAYTAKFSCDHQGLGTTWNKFLGELGSHDFVPNTSNNTINKYPAEYHIIHDGEKLSIEAHIRKGTGLAKDCLRIYIVQPRKPGEPVIVAQIGAHLPTADRSH
jgi:hypothetical protein